MAIGLIIIGDEIMSGKRQDKHFKTLVEMLARRHIQLSWAKCLGDEPDGIVATLKQTFATDDIVFCCGGIGSTPDDHTRKCAALALGLPMELHPEAKKFIDIRIYEIAKERKIAVDPTSPDNVMRLKMGEYPKGAKVIPNPVNRIPGFSFNTHYFLPGFPEMAKPMMEWVLQTYHSDLFDKMNLVEKAVFVYDTPESMLTPVLIAIEKEFLEIKTFSLPRMATEKTKAFVEVGVKGDDAKVGPAFESLQRRLDVLHVKYEFS